MDQFDGLELSARKAEYLKYIFEHGKSVKTTDISSRFNVDPSTVTKTIGELSKMGLIEHVPYRGVGLTPEGHEYAGFLIKRHRILGLVLTHYGIPADEACREALRFESLVSKSVIDTICQSMGHPTVGVCGRITHNKDCNYPEAGE